MLSKKSKIRLLALLFLAGLLALITVCFQLWRDADTAVLTHCQNGVNQSLSEKDHLLSDIFRELAYEMDRLAKSSALQKAEEKPAEVVQELAKPLGKMSEVVGNIHLVTDSGQMFSLRLEPGWTANTFSQTEYAIELLRLDGDGPLWLMHKAADPDEKSVYISERVRNADGLFYATLLFELELEEFSGVIQAADPADFFDQMIVSATGKILYHTEASLVGKQVEELPYFPEMKRNFNAGLPPGISSFYRENAQMYVFQYVSPQTGLIYYDMMPVEVIESDLMRYQWLVTGVPLLVAALGGCFCILFFRKDSRLAASGDEAEMAEKGNPASRQEALDQRGIDMIVRSFYLAVEMKDRYTAGHTERVTQYALAIYDQLGEEQKRMLPRDDLRYAGLLHDIGKVAIPDHILLKEGKLTREEYEAIKRHPTIGADLVEQIEGLAHVSPGVRYHHERWDGMGYPEGLKGEEIPLMARILAVADSFDAMTSTRTYRKAMSAQAAYEEIIRCSRTQFDPFVVKLFVRAYKQGKIRVPDTDSGEEDAEGISCNG